MTITSFTVISSDNTGSNRVEVVGNLAGTAPGGAYKIPLRLIYPKGSSPVLNRAVVEPWNSVLTETFGSTGQVVFELGHQVLGIPYLVETQGYTYCSFEWNKAINDLQITSAATALHIITAFFGFLAIPFDSTWAIVDGTDGLTIIRDVSEFVRDPSSFGAFGGLPTPPTSAKAFAYGFGQSAFLLRDWADKNHNSTFGSGFPNSLVFEGTLATNGGATVRTLTDTGPGYFSYDYSDEHTPASDGYFINLSTESELMIMEAARARETTTQTHYSSFEIAGLAHVTPEAATFITPIQATTLAGPVHRAMLENLRDVVDNEIALPPSVHLDGSRADRSAPLFAGVSAHTGLPFWGGFTAKTFVGVIGEEDGNFTGGIRLPHVRTRLGNGALVGAPLAIEHGTICLDASYSANSLPTSIQTCSPPLGFQQGMEIYFMIAGLRAPYEPSVLNLLYREVGEYISLITEGADYALANRWILQADRDQYVADAAAKFTTRQQLLGSGARRGVPPKPLA